MNRPEPDMERLRAQADRLLADPRLARAVLAHCSHLPTPAPAPGPELTRVHPDDQMLLHSLKAHGDVNASVGQYFNVALQQHFAAGQVIDAAFPEAQDLSILDFACGFGRLIRFLTLSRPTADIWASEIQPGALSFVRREYGVSVIPSCAYPPDFHVDRRFDFVWVASLFSHLPDGLFRDWLESLWSLLSPRGVLCFSVHDESLLPEGLTLPASGIHFSPDSENRDLSPSIYGVSHVSEGYVERVVESACGDGHPIYRIPRGLAHEQDLYVVPRTAGRDLSGLSDFRRGAWGWTQERALSGDGELYLSGWAASLDDGALPRVRIRLDDEWISCPTGVERRDVGRYFNDPRLDHCGWRFQHRLGPERADTWVEVSATSGRGERTLLYVGTLDNPAHLRPRPGAGIRRWLARMARKPGNGGLADG